MVVVVAAVGFFIVVKSVVLLVTVVVNVALIPGVFIAVAVALTSNSMRRSYCNLNSFL